MKITVVAFALVALSGCAAYQSLVTSAQTGGPATLPTATQVLASCAAEKAAGKTGINAPDCVAWTVLRDACDVASMSPALLAPAEAAGDALYPAVAVPNSLLNAGVSVSAATCKAYGWYDAAAAIVVTPAQK